MATSYEPVFVWVPRRLSNGRWVWLETIQRISTGGTRIYRRY